MSGTSEIKQAKQTSNAFVSVYQKGRTARSKGLAIDECPYNSSFEKFWREGWEDERDGRAASYILKKTE